MLLSIFKWLSFYILSLLSAPPASTHFHNGPTSVQNSPTPTHNALVADTLCSWPPNTPTDCLNIFFLSYVNAAFRIFWVRLLYVMFYFYWYSYYFVYSIFGYVSARRRWESPPPFPSLKVLLVHWVRLLTCLAINTHTGLLVRGRWRSPVWQRVKDGYLWRKVKEGRKEGHLCGDRWRKVTCVEEGEGRKVTCVEEGEARKVTYVEKGKGRSPA